MEDLSGKQLGPYQIVAPLGEGGMAAVYKAYQPAMERYVALKILPRHFANDPQFSARFQREAKLLAQLQHPHILPVFDFGEKEGYAYIVMPHVPSGTLADALHGEPLPLVRIRQVITQVGDALNYAHGRGMIHRDVKPSNVLIDEGGNCLLTDFGLARMVEGSVNLTASGTIMGTPAYMSPEQGSGGKIDSRSDIYSLGVILYEMATGRVPYRAETPMAVIFKHIQDPLPPARDLNPDLPEGLERVILRALSKRPADRYQTAADMLRGVQGAIQEARVAPAETAAQTSQTAQFDWSAERIPEAQPATLTKRSKRPIPVWTWGLIGIAAVAVVAVLLLWRNAIEGRPTPAAAVEDTARALMVQGTSLASASPSTKAPVGTAAPTAAVLFPTLPPVSPSFPTFAPVLTEPSVPSGSDTTYLSEAQPRSVLAEGRKYCVGRVPVGDPAECLGPPIVLAGASYPHSLFAHANSALEFDLAGGYDTLATSIFLFGATCGDGAFFSVALDGREIYMSPRVKHGDLPLDLRLDVRGGQDLRLVTLSGPAGDSSCDGTVWGEPNLVSNSAYDDFNDPQYDSDFNHYLWAYWGDDLEGAVQEGGLLTMESTLLINLLAREHERVAVSRPTFYEAKMRLSGTSTNGAVTLKLHVNITESSFWSTQCGLLGPDPGNRTMATLFCETGVGVDARSLYLKETKVGIDEWHTIRIEVDPLAGRMTYFADGERFGSADVPVEEPGLFSAVIGIYPISGKTVAEFDDVSFGPN